MLLYKLEFWRAIPTVTREYNPGSHRNSRKPMRFSLRHEMRPNSTALHAEQLCFPNPTRKEPRFAWLNSRESSTRLSQDKKNTDVTSGMQNWLVYPKSTQDEAHFPFIESIDISHSTSYTTWWHPLQQSRVSLRHPSQVYRNINFIKATGWKTRAPHLVWWWELIPCLRMKR